MTPARVGIIGIVAVAGIGTVAWFVGQRNTDAASTV